MGPKHDAAEILAGAVTVALAEGLSRLTYANVGTQLGISDRTVVYYFPTKDALVTAVLTELGARLQATLAPAMEGRVAGHRALARRAWPSLARPEADRTFALFFEANGLAAAGRTPYVTVVPQLVEGWVAWSEQLMTGAAERRRAEAEAAIALLDGLLLLRLLSGPEAAERAAERLGVVAPTA